MSSFKSIIINLPHSPGVYRFLDDKGGVLYVGKAIDLKKRVSSYFRKQKNQPMRLQKLIEKTVNIEYTVVDSELEALILETNLIKSYRPRYNILMKDDKNYVYLKITTNEDYPRITVTRQVERDGARYFGPKASAGELYRTLKWLKKVFPYRHCGLDIRFKGDSTEPLRTGQPGEGGGPFKVLVTHKVLKYPCIDYHIKRCVGPCIGTVTPEQYKKFILPIVHFFEGKTDEIVKDLKEKMQQAAFGKQFEKAARIRDQLLEMEHLMAPQRVSSPDGIDKDVIGLVTEGGMGYVSHFMFRAGKLKSQENFILNAVHLESGAELEDAEILYAFVQQYYEKATDIPREVLLPEPFPQAKTIEEWLTTLANHPVKFFHPKQGKSKALIQLANDNAHSFAKKTQVSWQNKEGKGVEDALKGLQKILKLPKLPQRIEGYDISHLGGQDTVGSMVVVEKGLPKKADYRHFKLRTVQERIDDYAAMNEVLQRRLRYLEPILSGMRKAKKKEIPQIEKILTREKLDTDDLIPHKILIIEKRKKIVGIVRTKPIEKDANELASLWVDPSCRGEGLARELVYAVMAKQRKGKLYVLPCQTLIDWYGSLGFHDVKEIPKFFEDKATRCVNACLIEKPVVMVYRFPKGEGDTSLTRKPHLIMVDGGKGQVSVAAATLKKAKLSIPLIGLAKKEEAIFMPGQSKPLILPKESAELQLLQRLRDEAHRFALKYQQGLRGERLKS
ncbi:MAG: UvrABC system protein C, excinuclease ABC subunit C [Candidatus Peregrinibacteria bacterium GW2011_GWE2_39_6]|nr:MAG: UvrABC system protein C, excinuclease ABC subunit C [Candidatus Peregrinibacteria bacterium GW2011_GWF2_39_17]KKR26007.1 MAG: UvrABC system protein C, excinuclease ABC subunit C [Candidatus Peregrinibacteria bacterium GW2011_GWE2_39_6]HCW31893.1 hypothetical protein [Candidatus Peregrinibacteria bacterium]